MKKLIFRKINKDTLYLFLLLSLSLGLIVWTIQAVNYLDYVTQDGHGLETYLLYSIYNFPKIINRLIPFVFFVSLFLILTNYETKNELLIFWTNGVTKVKFANRLIFISIILLIIQIIIGGFISPYFQLKSRTLLKESNIDFFSSLVKEGKFINAVKGLTIFIDKKNFDGSFNNIFIDDSSKQNTKMTYASKGSILDKNRSKVFRLYDGKVINKNKNKINVFAFDRIDINLSDYSTNTMLTPKIQETSSKNLISCYITHFYKQKDTVSRNCDTSIIKEIKQEVFKRFYKPIYIPILAIVCSFLIILPKNNNKYSSQSRLTFLFGLGVLIFSETTLRYSSENLYSTFIYLLAPWIIFITTYLLFYLKVKNV
tara:strand:- start:806 stop:1915 length:1110 start_codon:yes stop_codon:yes gene_type:complete